MHNSLSLDSKEIISPVKHYESVFDLLTNIPQFFEPSIYGSFICIFSNFINNYEGQREEFFNSYRGENAIIVNENLVSYFPASVYNGIDDLAETIMNSGNCGSSTLNLPTKSNFNFVQPETVYVYTEITNNI